MTGMGRASEMQTSCALHSSHPTPVLLLPAVRYPSPCTVPLHGYEPPICPATPSYSSSGCDMFARHTPTRRPGLAGQQRGSRQRTGLRPVKESPHGRERIKDVPTSVNGSQRAWYFPDFVDESPYFQRCLLEPPRFDNRSAIPDVHRTPRLPPFALRPGPMCSPI
ncbi:hypothetical protein BD309DRAFT_950906 [Dichomitus squalens]|nr:hypothetical protein BD309DRAFT_950906 [Dichomitus squalens]